jgi:SNF2 family DNA or RNA helicase
MGTGKSVMAISLIEFWYSVGLRKAIYVCPNALRGTMAREFAKWNSPLRVHALQPGSRPKRIAEIEAGDWDVLIINYEAVRGLWANIVRERPQMLIIDESQNIKHRTSQQTRAVRKIAEATRILKGRRAIMSGTPITKNVLDLWSQSDVLYPGSRPSEHPLGFGSFRAYERAVSRVIPHPRYGMRAPIHTFIPSEVSKVIERMAPYTVVIRSQDVLPELPKQSFVPISLEMGAEQKRLYNALKKDMVATLSHEAADDVTRGILSTYGIRPLKLTEDDFTVASTLATTLLLRLQQITSGFVKTETGALVSIPSIKHEWLADNLPMLTEPDGDHKHVIFCTFIHDVESIMELAEKLDIGAVRLDGSTSKSAEDIVAQLQTDPRVRLLVGNVAVAGAGFTMTAADTATFFSHSHRYDLRVQALKRIHRIGQTRPVRYYDLLAAPVDNQIRFKVSEKENIAVSTLDELREFVATL